MEGLPKDILRLLITKYMHPVEAVQCFVRLKVFHQATNKQTEILMKKRYYRYLCNFQEENKDKLCTLTRTLKIVMKNGVLCSCGATLRPSNSGNHERKCLGKIIRGSCDKCFQPLMTVYCEPGEKTKIRVYVTHHLDVCLARRGDIRRNLLALAIPERKQGFWQVVIHFLRAWFTSIFL